MTRILITVLALSMGLVACGGEGVGSPTEPTIGEPREPTTVPSVVPTTSTVPEASTDLEELDDRAQEIAEAAVDDLVGRIDVPPGEIELESFEFVTWNDGSLGCPRPGEMYTQALVEGSRTVLEHDGTTYDYHAGSDDRPFLCENPPVGSLPTTAPER